MRFDDRRHEESPQLLLSRCFLNSAVAIFIGAVGALLAVSGAIAQSTGSAATELGLKSSWCRSCKVRVREVLVLGDAEGPGVLGDHGAAVRRDSRGRFYLGGNFSKSIKVYGPDGDYVATIGREGEGPGEFRGIASLVVGEADSLYVFDAMNGSLSVFDRDYAHVRTARLETRPSIFLERVGRGRFVFSSRVPTSRTRYPLHLVGRVGEVEASFGLEDEEAPPIPSGLGRLASAGAGRVWVGFRHRYALELWDAFEGRKLRNIRREVDWFPPRSPGERPRMTVDAPPPTYLWHVSDDRRGRLWVQVVTADPRWRGAVEEGPDHPKVTDNGRYQDVVLEILDAGSGEALATLKFDRGFSFVDTGEGLIGATLIDERRLVSRFKIWRVELVPR